MIKAASETIRVSQYLDQVNRALKNEKARIVGEACNIQEYPGRSYLYFSVRDGEDGSTIKCFMWKNDYRVSGVALAEGMEVILSAYPAVYKPNGGLSLQVEAIELVGEGALKAAYDALKKKLESEGLFDESRKRAIPDFPQRVGVITSKSGAVINDFLSNVGKWGFEILFVDSKVEGQDAVKDLLAAVATLRAKEIDVLVVMRGGGSLESFLAFNNETLIRALADFPVPVITGIGHDKDAPLVSFISDKNVSTPTAVAALLSSGWSRAAADVRHMETKLFSEFDSRLKDARYGIEHSASSIEKKFVALFDAFRRAEAAMLHSVSRIDSALTRLSSDIADRAGRLRVGFDRLAVRTKETITLAEKTLALGNPARQLERGYSIVTKNGVLVRKRGDVSPGENIHIAVSDGVIKSQVL